MIRLGKSPTNLEAISLMTEILLTHILNLSNQEKFMSFKVQNKIWDPQNLIDTAHEKKNREMTFYMKCLESCYRYIYPEEFLCL